MMSNQIIGPPCYRYLLAALLLFFTFTSSSSADQRQETIKNRATLKTVTVPIAGICSAGLADIRQKLKHVTAISKIEGSESVEGIQISYAPDKLSPDRIARMITNLGYQTGRIKIP